LALDYLSKMKIALMVRQLDLGHILWCGRVVRVERAHRVRVVRGVQMGPGRLMALVLRVTTYGVTRWRCASPRSPRSWPMPRRACATKDQHDDGETVFRHACKLGSKASSRSGRIRPIAAVAPPIG